MTAEQTLVEIRRLRDRGRALAHGGSWFPVAVLAALVLASITLYRLPFRQPQSMDASVPYWAGLPDEQRSPLLSYAFWFTGTPVALALVAGWYRWRAGRVGVRIRWRPFVVIGLAALAALALLAAVPVAVPHEFGPPTAGIIVRNALLTPLLPIVVALVVLGFIERSRAIVVAGGWVALLTAWQTGSGRMGHIPRGGELTLLDLNRPGPLLILMAAPLVVYAAVRVLSGRR